MKKIKVLHLLEDLEMGGIEKMVAGIAQALDKQKFDVEVWGVVDGGVMADQLLSCGVKVRVLGIAHYYNPFHVWKFIWILKKERFDIIHTHGYFAATIGRIGAMGAGVPVKINHVHTIFHGLNARNRWIDQWLNRYTDQMVYVAEKVRQSFCDDGGYTMDERSCVIYNGTSSIDIKGRLWNSNVFKMINVASLTPHKGHKHLLNALALLRSSHPELQFHLSIVGEGPLRSSLEVQIEQLDLQTVVTLHGQQDNVISFLSDAHLFVLSSLREGLPVSIVEAMASGLAVIAPAVGGIDEVVQPHETGLLFQPGDERQIMSAIHSVLKNRDQARDMGRQSYERYVEMFRFDEMIKKIEDLYQNAFNSKYKF